MGAGSEELRQSLARLRYRIRLYHPDGIEAARHGRLDKGSLQAAGVG
jgi:hypothetical protein